MGVDTGGIPAKQLSPECLPTVEVSDLLSYLILETSFYTHKQFEAFKSLEVFNQMVSGFVTSVIGKVITGKYVVRACVRHSQHMNDHLGHFRKLWDYFVSPLLGMQSWTG